MVRKRQQYMRWLIGLIVLVIASYLLSKLYLRYDLTAEKRYTLSNSTVQLLNDLDTLSDGSIDITLFLDGDLPADYRKLSASTEELLNNFKQLSGGMINVKFEKPGESLDDTARLALYDSLARIGVVFENAEEVSTNKDAATSRLIIPSALVQYGNKMPIAIDLRSSRKIFRQFNVINDVPQEDVEATRNAAEALLEYKFANAIDKLTRTKVPVVAYVIGNGQPDYPRVTDLVNTLKNEYRLGIFDLKQSYPHPAQIDALLMVKPSKPFTDEDKLKLDQYILNGGKVIWMIDKLYAEMDSLLRSQRDFVAFDRGLNIDDLLFKYGVRINSDLVQDLNCSKIPMVIGQNADGSPRMQRIPWPYYPFLSGHQPNPISRNLDRVLPLFPSSIDTVKAPGITKTVLLATDTNSRRLQTPAMVSLNSVRTDEDFASFQKSYIPVAVLLEGQFQSPFAYRLSQEALDSLQRNTGKPFITQAAKSGKQIVIADGDIVTNMVSQTQGTMPMGMIPLENYRFANREFMLNCVDYLVSERSLYESRNKDFVLRLLDKEKVARDRGFWQLIGIGMPILLIILLGFFIQWRRKSTFAGPSI